MNETLFFLEFVNEKCLHHLTTPILSFCLKDREYTFNQELTCMNYCSECHNRVNVQVSQLLTLHFNELYVGIISQKYAWNYYVISNLIKRLVIDAARFVGTSNLMNTK